MNTHMDRLAAEVVSLRKTGGGGGGGLPKEFAEQWEVRVESERCAFICLFGQLLQQGCRSGTGLGTQRACCSHRARTLVRVPFRVKAASQKRLVTNLTTQSRHPDGSCTLTRRAAAGGLTRRLVW